jgi:flavin-dependent dehydrogenase
VTNGINLHSTLYTPVAIVGGGPAGAATALSLVRAGVGVVLIDGTSLAREKVGESLPPSVNALLQRLGVWDAFLATKPLPCHANRSAWGGGRLLEYSFIADPHGHGWHIDRPRFDAMLVRAAQTAGVLALRHTRASGVHQRSDGRWQIALPDGTTIASDVLVDATGRGAAISGKVGGRWRRVDRLVAAVGLLTPSGTAAVDSATLVESIPDGWWYSAALPDGRLVAAFMTDPDRLSDRQAGTPAGWSTLLAETHHTWERVRQGDHRLAGSPRVHAAASGRLEVSAGDGWLAVGDAAASHDPLSSHGIGSALESGLRAGVAIRDRLGGDREALIRYAEQNRRAYARYQAMWLAYYAEEQRWPDAPFWRRRHVAAQQAAAMMNSGAARRDSSRPPE